MSTVLARTPNLAIFVWKFHSNSNTHTQPQQKSLWEQEITRFCFKIHGKQAENFQNPNQMVSTLGQTADQFSVFLVLYYLFVPKNMYKEKELEEIFNLGMLFSKWGLKFFWRPKSLSKERYLGMG